MTPDLQHPLENERIRLIPLQDSDFEDLYAVASDPKVWEQHPNKSRSERAGFQTFFDGALVSNGAFKVLEKQSGKVIGSTRFYDYKPEDKSIFIGYTFYAPAYWGTGINHLVKTEMIDYIFHYVSTIYFHIAAINKRSQVSLERLGARKIEEKEIEYYGEPSRMNFVYCLQKEDWINKKTK